MADGPVTYDFTGRTALITGAAGGIGAAIAEGLASAGATVWLLDRDPVVEETAAGLGARAVLGDLRDPALPAVAVAEATAVTGRLDVLVTAAGVQVRTAGADIPEDDWQRLADVNLSATYRTMRAAVPYMRAAGSTGSAASADSAGDARGAGGAILAVSSMSADRAVPGIVPYGATKAAVSHLVRGLAVELGAAGIRVNGIAPGYVDTAMTAALLADPERSARIRERISLGRVADPADMVGPSLFLLSDAAAYVTGQILAVDGGYALT